MGKDRLLGATLPSLVPTLMAIAIGAARAPFWWLLFPAALLAVWWFASRPFAQSGSGEHRIEAFDFAIAAMVFAASFLIFAVIYGIFQLTDLFLS